MQVVVWEITIKLFVDDKDFVPVRNQGNLFLQICEHVVELLHKAMKHLMHLITISMTVA